MIRPLDLMEPEETVGNLWHDWASRRDSGGHAGATVAFEAVRPSVAMLFRALGGPPATEIVPAPASTAVTVPTPAIGPVTDAVVSGIFISPLAASCCAGGEQAAAMRAIGTISHLSMISFPLV